MTVWCAVYDGSNADTDTFVFAAGNAEPGSFSVDSDDEVRVT